MPKGEVIDFPYEKGDEKNFYPNVKLLLPVYCVSAKYCLLLINIGLILAKHYIVCLTDFTFLCSFLWH